MPSISRITGRSARVMYSSGGRERERGLVRPGDGEVLGHHLADDDVQVGDDEQRQRQGDRVRQGLGQARAVQRPG